MATKWLGRGAIFAVAATVTSIFFINFCATIFQCGCQSLFGLAAANCNIHAAHGRHCPWCVYGQTGYSIVYGSMLVAQGLVASGLLFPGWGWMARLCGSLIAFPAVGLVLALAFGLQTGYWH